MDGEARHCRWSELPAHELAPGISLRLVAGERVMMAYFELEPGRVIATHSHDNEQLTHVLEGRMRLWHGEDERVVDVVGGEMVHLPPNVPHRAEVVERTVLLDIFAPPREDWLEVVRA